MPELPEVEHVVRALRRAIVGRQIVASQIKLPKLITPLKPAQFSRTIKGVRIEAVNRRGKYILIELDSDRILAVHLRMTGKFLYLTGDDDLPKHSHAIFYLDNDRRLVFCDQRQFGVIKLVAYSRVAGTKGIRELAPEPFSDEFSFEYLKETLQTANLFPLPTGRVSPDQLSRVPIDRVVRSERGRSTFASWLATQNNAKPSHQDPVNFVRDGRRVGPLRGNSSTLLVEEAVAKEAPRSADRQRAGPPIMLPSRDLGRTLPERCCSCPVQGPLCGISGIVERAVIHQHAAIAARISRSAFSRLAPTSASFG